MMPQADASSSSRSRILIARFLPGALGFKQRRRGMRRIVAGLSIVALTLVGALNANLLAQASGSMAKMPTKTATGIVKTVSPTSLVITSAGKDMTFTVDSSTSVVASGAGTKAATKGGKIAIADVVAAGNQVRVTYHDMSGTMHAQSVRVTAKAK
jgi:hypothetical protein